MLTLSEALVLSTECIPNDHDLPKPVSQVTVGGLQALDKDTRAHLAACPRL